MEVTETSIPQDLRDISQWVVFRIEPNDDGKPTKKPYQAKNTRALASSTNRGTWATYEQACDAVERDRTLSGIGFVFTVSDEYMGIDLDHCIVDGVLTKQARRIIDRLQSYSEYSPSGDGVHVIVKASVLQGRKNTRIEMYSSGRYFTMTGRHIEGTPFEVFERQDVVNEIYAEEFPTQEESPPPTPPRTNNVLPDDRELLTQAMTWRNGDELRRLYFEGDTSSHNGDESAADLALCNHLAFMTGRDAVRMDALFRASKLYRKKWDEKRGQLTYGQMTIQKAIANCHEVYTPGGNLVPYGGVVFGSEPAVADLSETLPEKRVDLGAIMRNGTPETNWLIVDLLVRGRIHVLYGEPESGKTILALAWILIVIARGENVLFVDEEGGADSISKLLKALGADPDLVSKHIYYFPFPSIDSTQYEQLLAYVDQIRPSLIVMDSLTDMLSVAGLDENNGNEVTSWMLSVAQRLARLEYQPAVLLIDHVTKDVANTKYSVASRAKKAKADVLWFIDKASDFDTEKTANVVLRRHKNRPGVLPKEVTYVIGGQDGRLICERFNPMKHQSSGLSKGAEQLLMAIEDNDGEMTPAHASKLFNISAESVRLRADELERKGRIERVGRGRATVYLIPKVGDSMPKVGDSESPSKSPNFTPSIGGNLGISESARKQRDRSWMEKFD